MHSFLNDYYQELGAKFVPFSGYSMPINFSLGIIKEHKHTYPYGRHRGNVSNVSVVNAQSPSDFTQSFLACVWTRMIM